MWPSAFIATAIVAVFYLLVNLAQVWWVGAHDNAKSADAIVVLGAAQYDGRPSKQLQARLDHVLLLWDAHIAPRIIVTGGNKPGDRFTEASASAAYLEKAGVPADAILREAKGTNTYDSLADVRTMMKAAGWKTAVVVTDPYHSLRSVLTLAQLGITATASATTTSPVKGVTAFDKHLKEALGVSLGRIVGFRRLLSITG